LAEFPIISARSTKATSSGPKIRLLTIYISDTFPLETPNPSQHRRRRHHHAQQTRRGSHGGQFRQNRPRLGLRKNSQASTISAPTTWKPSLCASPTKTVGSRLNAIGSLSVFGKKATPHLPALRECLASDDPQVKERAQQTIAAIEKAPDTTEEETKFAAIQKKIIEFVETKRKEADK